ncbi:MAG: hypothetical protein H0V78_11475 [Burkholderiales bacterium]|nr:hypothetical protein [Burkholderiales bacterium]
MVKKHKIATAISAGERSPGTGCRTIGSPEKTATVSAAATGGKNRPTCQPTAEQK